MFTDHHLDQELRPSSVTLAEALEDAQSIMMRELGSSMHTPPLSPDTCCLGDEPLDVIDGDDLMRYAVDEDDDDAFGAIMNMHWNAKLLDDEQTLLHDCMWSGSCKEKGCKGHKGDFLTTTVQHAQHLLQLDQLRRRRRFNSVSSTTSSTMDRPVSPLLFGGSLVVEESTPAAMSPEVEEPQTEHVAYPWSDHSYHASPTTNESNEAQNNTLLDRRRNVPAQNNSWGVVTPSDSEEEIDVVSLSVPTKVKKEPSMKRTYRKRQSSKPSQKQYKQQLQRAVLVASRKNANTNNVRKSLRVPKKSQSQSLKLTLKRVSSDENTYQAETQVMSKRYNTRDKRPKVASPPSPKRRLVNISRSNTSLLGSLSSSCEDDDEDDDEVFLDELGQPIVVEKVRRREHNDMERKRRNDMKSNFQCLRLQVPKLKGQDRAPKVTILNEARACIKDMRIEEQGLMKSKKTLLLQMEKLKKRLQELTSNK